ncbi:MAG: hypothetical protein ACI83P_000102 [Janthinobacterium sp.]
MLKILRFPGQAPPAECAWTIAISGSMQARTHALAKRKTQLPDASKRVIQKQASSRPASFEIVTPI